jgi:hypothetical protein
MEPDLVVGLLSVMNCSYCHVISAWDSVEYLRHDEVFKSCINIDAFTYRRQSLVHDDDGFDQQSPYFTLRNIIPSIIFPPFIHMGLPIVSQSLGILINLHTSAFIMLNGIDIIRSIKIVLKLGRFKCWVVSSKLSRLFISVFSRYLSLSRPSDASAHGLTTILGIGEVSNFKYFEWGRRLIDFLTF